MRGVLVTQWTEFENLVIEDCPRPALENGQLRIKTQAAGISFATSLVVAGRYQRKPPLPFVPGTEAAGIVTEIAGDVDAFKTGDRVACILDWGGLAQEAVAHAVKYLCDPR
jgi:NADPH2:quinone reductase